MLKVTNSDGLSGAKSDTHHLRVDLYPEHYRLSPFVLPAQILLSTKLHNLAEVREQGQHIELEKQIQVECRNSARGTWQAVLSSMPRTCGYINY